MPLKSLKRFKSSRMLCFLLGFQLTFIPLLFRNSFRQRSDFTIQESYYVKDEKINLGEQMNTHNNSAMADNITNSDTEAKFMPYLNITKPENPIIIQEVWQKQEGKYDIFLYSAFYDDRPGLDSVQIRVVSIAEKHVNNISCLIWHGDRSYPDVANATKTDIGQQITRGKKGLKQNMFSCKINSEATYKPQYVSIITLLQPQPTNAIKIHYPEKPPKEKVIEFGHCLSVLYWQHDPLRTVEWVELQKLWGVKEFNVYANTLDAKTRYIFQNYPHGTVVNFHEFPGVLNDTARNTIRLNMSPALNDCLYRNMYRYKFIVCTDTDELIVPLLQNNYSDMLIAINKKHKIKHPHPSYVFRNVYFFTDLGVVDNKSSHLHTQQYMRHIKPSNAGYSPKSITNPLTCAGLQNHYCWKKIPQHDYHGVSTNVDKTIGMSFHFKKCHFDEYLHRPGECAKLMTNYTTNPRMKQFSHVQPAVDQVMKTLQLS